MFDYETKNRSFIAVHEQLKAQGIENNEFMLTLKTKKVKELDPYHAQLMPKDVEIIRKEARTNIWYFLRECCSYHAGVQPTDKSEKFHLTQGSLAAAWLSMNGYSYAIDLPKSYGKTTSSLFILQWYYMCGNGKAQYEVVGRTDEDRSTLCDIHNYMINAPGYLGFVPNMQDRMDHPVWYETPESLLNDIDGSSKVKRIVLDDFYHYENNEEVYNTWAKTPKTKRPILMITGNLTLSDNDEPYMRFANEFEKHIVIPWSNEYYDHPEELKEKINDHSIILVKYEAGEL